MKEILQALGKSFPNVQTVGIGGINESNAKQLMKTSASADRRLDGIAIVSAIMGAEDPQAAALRLASKPPPKNQADLVKVRGLVGSAPDIITAVFEKKPLSHNMTNTVCTTFPFQRLRLWAGSLTARGRPKLCGKRCPGHGGNTYHVEQWQRG